MKKTKKLLLAGILSATGFNSYAQEAKEDPLAFLTEGKATLNMRFRFENADGDQRGDRDESNALTWRTRLGYETASWNGFTLFGEMEHTVAHDDGDYFGASLNGDPNDSVIADPETTELNRAWIKYSYEDFSSKFGRQRIILDNARHVGNVGWRQNEQTFDALSFTYKKDKLKLFYAYIAQVKRIFGDDSNPANFTDDYESESHLINASYAVSKELKITTYAYLLDLSNQEPHNYSNSCATYGVSLSGSIDPGLPLTYWAEFATQSDYADSNLDYTANYVHVNLKASFDKFALIAGYELLGTDNGVNFKTPLGTNHKFNGWADRFIGPGNAGGEGNGIADYYIGATTKIAGVTAKAFYHYLDQDEGSGDYANEINVVLVKKITKGLKATLKGAHSEGGEMNDGTDRHDITRYWAQLDYSF